MTKSNQVIKKQEPQIFSGVEKMVSWKDRRGRTHKVQTKIDRILLTKKDVPIAEMFYTYYKLEVKKSRNAKSTAARAVTFVFNGGPGASSAYLHIGGVGPLRVLFSSDGRSLMPPAKLVNNTESWIEFTDLVFIDPVGTGFSRMLPASLNQGVENRAQNSQTQNDQTNFSKEFRDEKEFFKLNRDLDSFCEFVERFLSLHGLWGRPIAIAGESYGGFRTAKLARKFQEDHGLGLNAAIAISPCLDWTEIASREYNTLGFIDSFCSMALVAAHHGVSRVFKRGTPIEKMRPKIETFAQTVFAQLMIVGLSRQTQNLDKLMQEVADYIGLPLEVVRECHGRVSVGFFVRELLKKQHLIIGCYDGSITAIDPFPDRETHQAPDPTLAGIASTFTSGINQMLREILGFQTERKYELLNDFVNASWTRDEQRHVFDTAVGAVDDIRYAMSLSPHMKIMIVHGYYDLVTPYFSSERLVSQMRLKEVQLENLHIKHFEGGHMFYSWDESRLKLLDWVRDAFK